MTDPALDIEVIFGGLGQPTTMAFHGRENFLVLEKATGQVLNVMGGVLQPGSALDLAAECAGERSLLGIATHPDFRPGCRAQSTTWRS